MENDGAWTLPIKTADLLFSYEAMHDDPTYVEQRLCLCLRHGQLTGNMEDVKRRRASVQCPRVGESVQAYT